MEIQKSQRIMIDALEDVKARDIKVFSTSHLTGLFDRVIICSATSSRQTRAIARNVIDTIKEKGLELVALEGEDTGEWVLVDVGDIVLHIMQPAVREYYNLEEIWGDKPAKVQLLPESTKPLEAHEWA